ncbi:hypothetical protein SELMODRAFT_449094 [Selaginella moellendorffii]|uniref:dynamin GTPase n=1 Tax=Selaginella moellendorffii TaxID=88036 RepID=D8TCK1_SELML|nr:dynamin-2A [Selaginella moellendorffii]EFJ05623.1 hypothetical protein SELMODRAFT_449094 [Selaginella moellendorffii]|eukprot:XP_002993298.1 dynamin-2A [Selaginella moellendorffii]
MENLRVLAESMQQASALLSDQEGEESLDQYSSFLSVVALGNTGAGKSAVLNSLIGYAVLPTGENGATRAPVTIDLEADDSGNKRGLTVQMEGKSMQVSATDIRHSLQNKFGRMSTGAVKENIHLKLKCSSAPPLKLVDLPGLESRSVSDSLVREYIDSNDALLLVVIPATSVRDITGSQALKIAQDIDHEGSRTVGVISKIDQAASDPKSLAAVQAVLSGQGPSITSKFTWIALIGQSVSIAGAHSKDDSLETAWKAEMESLKSILGGASSSRLGRSSLVEAIAKQIRQRMQQRLPSLLSSLEGRSQDVEEELVRLGEKMVETEEGTRAVALELCREFEDKFLEHINSGEGGSYKVVTSFEGTLPNRIKQLPLQELFDLNGLKKVVLEADGYLPYLLSPEKGLRELIRRALDLAKDPAKSCVDEVHRVLVEIVSSAASATPGLGRFPPLKREMISVASSALDEYRTEAKRMVVDLVDMERAYIPPQHFTRLVQRRLDRVRREDEVKNKTMKKAQEAEQAILNKSTYNPAAQANGSLKSAKDGDGKDVPESSGAEKDKTGYLSKRSATSADTWNKRWFVLNEKSNKLGYMKKPDDKRFQGVINLEECLIEELSEEELAEGRPSKSKEASKQANGPEPNLTIKISNKVAYKTVLKAQHVVALKAESMAEKTEWMTKLRQCTDQGKGSSKAVVEVVTPLRTSMSDGALDTVITRRADPEEELRIMAQEVRDYVEAVMNSLSANIPKAAIFCQVERSKDSMLSTLYKSISALPTPTIKELLQEDAQVKRRRERCERQASVLSRLVRQLSNNEARVTMSNGYIEGTQNGYHGGDDWRVAFEEAANSPSPRTPSGFSSSSRRSLTPHRGEALENGDSSRRTPTRRPPPPVPGIGAPTYRQ